MTKALFIPADYSKPVQEVDPQDYETGKNWTTAPCSYGEGFYIAVKAEQKDNLIARAVVACFQGLKTIHSVASIWGDVVIFPLNSDELDQSVVEFITDLHEKLNA